ncbi:MAG: valine--tRNA ligase [Deltaproteobacteria bacterium]|nr:valine--tRNA ligase [Deltaproteobacteria bacterium]MBW2020607.1 valine--tRNA ligase [Deltaproteobacteria bacterium]MBW2075494.1 valine--tRNA ligase [Deltaproteobacteria bacterium]RLB81563.1 MAG: valine--tRNA ligase [Deltaproteobacteria bacterium]
MSSHLLRKGYESGEVERRWYAYWEKEGLFAAEDVSDKKPFSIVIPPPNVTGVLHMGHAHNNTLQDILCRYRRMRGDNVLWMPGTDHAGIATQNVVEKVLAKEGKDRHSLGREEFIKRVWQWREEYGGLIIKQLKRLGASCDWDRERFTMDEGLSEAVRTVFVQLYQQGLIYRGHYIINWCPRCQTALSDLEVEHEDHNGHLYYVRYPLEDGKGGIIVATTRPETMLGDTAVAVNPNDERYQALKGKAVILPLMNRRIPIIFDEYVDMKFGTGALKITPAHDPHDFDIGQRHDLDAIKVIGSDGRMNEQAGRFQGKDRFECREAVVEALREEGLLEKVEPYQHSVGHCYRCRTTVEPYLSQQWFVKVKPLAEKAIAAVQTGATRIIPDTWTKTYFEWMNNIKDWCISRQIWWGHRIPAWTCETCGELIVAMEPPTACPACKGSTLVQETDVLDTWFSSALWPFSTMGWPDDTQTLKTFYPTSVLVTGFDILFFWVARMMMMGLHFMKEVPFRDVYIHALVRDADGKKMSKSKGNVIDPLYVIDAFGADAFRFTLAALAAQGRDIKLSEDRIEGYRHFINKLWNAARFSLMHLSDFQPDVSTQDARQLSLADRWILSRLNGVVEMVTKGLDEYKFNEAAMTLYQFVWHEFCDWYLEIIKPVLYGSTVSSRDGSEVSKPAHNETTRFVLWSVLNEVLRLLHPFIPFVTEEIWNKLPGTEGSIMKAEFPAVTQERHDPEAEAIMNLLMGITGGIRNIRGEMNVPPSMRVTATVQSADREAREILEAHQDIVINLARLETLNVTPPGKRPPSCATSVFGNSTIFVSLKDIIDFKAEQARLNKEIGKIIKELEGVGKKLSNEDFLTKAPQAVVEGVRAKQERLVEKKNKLEGQLRTVSQLAGELEWTKVPRMN